jgi:hypothetical protein
MTCSLIAQRSPCDSLSERHAISVRLAVRSLCESLSARNLSRSLSIRIRSFPRGRNLVGELLRSDELPAPLLALDSNSEADRGKRKAA